MCLPLFLNNFYKMRGKKIITNNSVKIMDAVMKNSGEYEAFQKNYSGTPLRIWEKYKDGQIIEDVGRDLGLNYSNTRYRLRKMYDYALKVTSAKTSSWRNYGELSYKHTEVIPKNTKQVEIKGYLQHFSTKITRQDIIDAIAEKYILTFLK